MRDGAGTEHPQGGINAWKRTKHADDSKALACERARAGLDAAWARGREGSRPRERDAKQGAPALTPSEDRSNTIRDICRTPRIGRTTLSRSLAEGDRR